ncbi:hypothetical protein O181_087306 [Austropuccinia psidii MF-1]|uniref:Nudix hydrolase domain-containing protein n=1 Tax=Austropuccinia psidii MF-1 TaxID=1389203 RepID=A0A9Q3IPF5_9BASI|nr:hypothetical protein [Austropuccinia psidii MF-1]
MSKRLIQAKASTQFSVNKANTRNYFNPKIRLAASLILIQPLENFTLDGFNYQTLLLKRSHNLSNFPSAHVFPGGQLDQQDQNYQEIHQGNQEIHQGNQEIHQGNQEIHRENQENALKICAIRETFEESGILVGLDSLSNKFQKKNNHLPEILQDFRQKLLKNQIGFNSINKILTSSSNHQLTISFNKLFHLANFISPKNLSKRWDTHFYITVLPDPIHQNHHHPLSTPDGLEAISSHWLTPNQALNRSNPNNLSSNQILQLAPPQFYLLSHLNQFKDYHQLFSFGLPKSVPKFLPEIIKSSNKTCFQNSLHNPQSQPQSQNHQLNQPQSQTQNQNHNLLLVLPGDPLHSSSNQQHHSSKARHRIIIHDLELNLTNSDHDPLNPKTFFCPIKLERHGLKSILGSGWEDV